MLRPTTVANRLRRPEQALEMSVRGGSFLDAGDYRPEGPCKRFWWEMAYGKRIWGDWAGFRRPNLVKFIESRPRLNFDTLTTIACRKMCGKH